MANKRKKIILLTEYFPPESGAGSTRAFEHAKRWVENGIDVTVLTCMPHYPTGVIPEKYKGKYFYREEISGVEVLRTFTYAAESKGFFRRGFAYFAFMLSSVIQGMFIIPKADYLIATSPPFSIGISGLILSKIRSIKLVFEVRDLWPESLIQLGQIKNKYLIKILEWIEIKIYKQSEFIVSVTDSYCPIIANKGIDPKKIHVVKNGVDIDYFTPQAKNVLLLDKLNLRDKRIASYFGNFGLSQPIDKVIEVANSLKTNSQIHFLIIGDGEKWDKLNDMIHTYQLSNVTLLKTVSREELKQYYSITDLMIVPLQNIPLFKNVVPSKIYEIMAMEKPMLLSVDGEARRIMEDAEAGMFHNIDDLIGFGDEIINLLGEKTILQKMSSSGREYVIKNHDRNIIAENYLMLLE